MKPPRWPAIWMLGAGQCVYWGILYYAYAVLLVPMRAEFGVSQATIAGAFSVGLGISAWLAPSVGRRLDRGDGPRLFRAGAIAAAVLLVVWSFVTNVVQLYLVWIGLGGTMAVVLYEAAFALVTRALADSDQRLRALASVTVMGGLASTVFVPLVGAGIALLDWRWTLRSLAIVWGVTAVALELYVLPSLRDADSPVAHAMPGSETRPISHRAVVAAGTPFVVATFAAMAMTTLLIPRLVAQGHAIAAASWVLAALGIMQLPGRLWLLRRGNTALPAQRLLMAPLALQVIGLLTLVLAHSLIVAGVGVAVFGMGAGLHTLARPWIVTQLFGVAASGHINGRIARAQGIARAAAPFAAAAGADAVGTPFVLSALAFALLACLPVAATVARRIRAVPSFKH